MSGHIFKAEISWFRLEGETYLNNRYSRFHHWWFDGGLKIPASASPTVVPIPLSRADAVDPQEAFVAAVSSCHMLTFMSLAAKAGFQLDSYVDKAEGYLAKNTNGKFAILKVTLSPEIVFSGEKLPTQDQFDELHHATHNDCFIANSVACEIVVADGCVPKIAA